MNHDDRVTSDPAVVRVGIPSRADDRRPYAAPAIIALGDVRDLTLGGSPGVGDSGGGATQKCPGC